MFDKEWRLYPDVSIAQIWQRRGRHGSSWPDAETTSLPCQHRAKQRLFFVTASLTLKGECHSHLPPTVDYFLFLEYFFELYSRRVSAEGSGGAAESGGERERRPRGTYPSTHQSMKRVLLWVRSMMKVLKISPSTLHLLNGSSSKRGLLWFSLKGSSKNGRPHSAHNGVHFNGINDHHALLRYCRPDDEQRRVA